MNTAVGRVADEINERVVAQFGLQETTRVIADLKHLIKVLAVLAPVAETDTEPRKVTNAAKHTRKHPRLSH
jgi:hypothetical protein